jgi:two-component system nitrogen regulation response regulator NtrX
LTPAARTLLAALPWRGNADELRLLVERVALAVPRRAVLLEDVLGQISFDGASVRPPAEGTLRAARRRFERDYIVAVLLEHRGRVSEAARALGLERTNLYRKMKQLGIRPPTASSGS